MRIPFTRGRSRVRVWRTALLVPAVLAASLYSSPATAVGSCVTPPSVFPIENVTPGLTGTGWTVIQGTTPVSFDVTVLGVLPNGIAPGIDFILVQVSGPVIDQTGGVAAGFSGSPVYVGSDLLGAISYGFFAADQTIAGVTPAQPMVDIFNYAENTGAPAGSAPTAVRTFAKNVELTPSLRATAAKAVGVSTSDFTGTASQLLTPLAVSGLSDTRMQFLTDLMASRGQPVIPYRAGSIAGTPSGPVPPPLQPGDSFAAAQSAGDLTYAGVGTATATCGNLVVAFGHPFFFEGPTHFGLTGADVLTVVKDPSSLFGGFKIANLTAIQGTVDQDRLAGVRAIDGALPTVAPITANLTNLDTGKFRSGETDAFVQDVFPFIAALHQLADTDSIFDEIGSGTTDYTWTIKGTTSAGDFQLTRHDPVWDSYDVSFASIFELLFDLETIQQNKFTPVTFTNVKIDGSVTTARSTENITNVLESSNTPPALIHRLHLYVHRGDTIHVRTRLLPFGSTTSHTVDQYVKVPTTAHGHGTLVIRPGISAGGDFFFYDYGAPAPTASSFDGLLAQLANGEQNNQVVARLSFLFPKLSRTSKVADANDHVVQGAARIVQIDVL